MRRLAAAARRVLNYVDCWYEYRHKRRVDRGPVYVSVMVAIFCFACSAIIIGPVPTSLVSAVLPPDTQDLMAICMLMGSSLCLFGIMSGSKWLRSNVAARDCYKFSLAGVPALALGLFVYGGAVVTSSYINGAWVGALGGVLGPLIALGDVIQGALLWLEVRRINRAIPLLKAIEENSGPLPRPRLEGGPW